jgi:hypothetical protein
LGSFLWYRPELCFADFGQGRDAVGWRLRLCRRGWHARPQSDFIRLDQQEVPSLLETMSVEPGVTLREKGASKQGPKEEPDASRMTRADFMELVQSTSNLAQQSSFQDDAREVLPPPSKRLEAATRVRGGQACLSRHVCAPRERWESVQRRQSVGFGTGATENGP